MSSPRRLSWSGPPLALQIVALLIGGLVVAQLVTLFLTMLMPPAPVPQYELADIAAALADRRGDDHKGLQRIVQPGPPDISGPGWLVSEGSRRDLARLMRVEEGRVALAFYTPLPFAGTTAARNYAMADDGAAATFASMQARLQPEGRLVLAEFVLPDGRAIPQMTEGRRATLPRDSFPPGMLPGNGANRAQMGAPGQGAQVDRARRDLPLISIDPRVAAQPGGLYIPGDGGAAVPPLLRGEAVSGAVSVAQQPAAAAAHAQGGTGAGTNTITQLQLGIAERIGAQGSNAVLAGSLYRPLLPRAALPNSSALIPQVGTPLPSAPAAVAPPLLMPETPPPAPPPAPPARSPGDAAPRALAIPPVPQGPLQGLTPAQPSFAPPRLAPPPEYSAPPSGPPIAVNAPARSLFGFAPAPFVEGDFVAALRMPDGRWSVVQPAPEPFPNSWQRRLLLWFAISLALVAPFGWLFARRLVKPLDRFARAAEQLGRDPSVAIGPLDGPAEIGRAAHAFNLMQGRLRAFVDDRTAMVGAISHDLRTPLTRMRFRIEDVPDDVRDGLLEEVAEMEAMIAQVIDYIRDASTPGARERLDLFTLVEEAVEDARLVGGQVVIEHADPAPVEVDVLGLRRVLDNLLENAIKYGDRARIRLRTEGGSAIAEIIDEGPGLPEDEIERAFEPFYRGDAARASAKSGSGLGLAVCRSIARAHGGDVRLRRSGEGFLAEMRVPLAFDAERPLAA